MIDQYLEEKYWQAIQKEFERGSGRCEGKAQILEELTGECADYRAEDEGEEPTNHN